MIKTNFYRFLSHITYGKLHEKYRAKYKAIRDDKNRVFYDIIQKLSQLTEFNNYTNSNFNEITQKLNYLTDVINNNINFKHDVCVNYIRWLNLAKSINSKTFAEYKNKYAGQDVVLVATGPSLNSFKPIKDAIYVGVNAAFLNEKLKLDYLFVEDWFATNSYLESAKDYKCKKFYGINDYMLYKDRPGSWTIPESVALRHNAQRFVSLLPEKINIDTHIPFAYDICNEPLYCWGSIAFPALQFILYTNPKRIYLVGCDCTTTGHFNNEKSKIDDEAINYVRYGWNLFKDFANRFYPDTEIVSVNPVGLRGMFKDLDQKG